MKIRIVVILIISFLFHSAIASAEYQVTNPFLYQVKKDNKVSYMFGTIHIGISMADLPLWVVELHKKTDVHAYEMYMPDPAYYTQIQALSSDLTSEAVKSFLEERKAAKENFIPFSDQDLAQLDKLGFPRAVAMATGATLECDLLMLRKYIFDSKYVSLDFELMHQTEQLGKISVSLEDETIRDKADALVDAEKCFAIELMYEESLLEQFSFDHVVEDYVLGLEENSYPEAEETDLFYRNAVWMPELTKLFTKGNAFASFGVAHFYGEQGIIRLLEDEGFQVRRITDPSQL